MQRSGGQGRRARRLSQGGGHALGQNIEHPVIGQTTQFKARFCQIVTVSFLVTSLGKSATLQKVTGPSSATNDTLKDTIRTQLAPPAFCHQGPSLRDKSEG